MLSKSRLVINLVSYMTENQEKIINILSGVPEKKLYIIELANSVPRKNGDYDIETVNMLRAEINLAAAEAQSYATHTTKAVNAILQVTGSPRLTEFTEEDLEAGLIF